jgi:hypothetical protein
LERMIYDMLFNSLNKIVRIMRIKYTVATTDMEEEVEVVPITHMEEEVFSISNMEEDTHGGGSKEEAS